MDQQISLRAVKGAPLTIFIAMCIISNQCGEKEIATVSGYSDLKTIRAHLRTLAHLGLVTRVSKYYGWQLTYHGSQLALMIGSAELQLDGETGNGGFPLSINTRHIPKREVSKNTNLSDKEYLLVLGRLKALSIHEPVRSELATQAFISVDYIDRWLEFHQNIRNRKKQNTAFLIYLLRSGDPPPPAHTEDPKYGYLAG